MEFLENWVDKVDFSEMEKGKVFDLFMKKELKERKVVLREGSM